MIRLRAAAEIEPACGTVAASVQPTELALVCFFVVGLAAVCRAVSPGSTARYDSYP